MDAKTHDVSRLGGRDHDLMLTGLLQLLLEHATPALDAAIHAVDDYLFDRSGTGDGTELIALRELRRVRAGMMQAFRNALSDSVRGIGRAGVAVAATGRDLSLLTDEALERQLASEQAAENLSRLHGAALRRLEARLAALLQRPNLDPLENPFGPPALAAAMRDALGGSEHFTCVHVALFKFAERELAAPLATFYNRANERLAAAGLLPQLEGMPSVRRPGGAAAAAVARGHADAGTLAGMAGLPAMPPGLEGILPSAHGGAGAAGYGPIDPAAMSGMLELLQAWRQRSGAARYVANDAWEGPSLREADMMSVLSLMQNEQPLELDTALDDGHHRSLADHLRQEVLAGARRLGLGDDRLRLSSNDADAVDLVGMLFDVLLDERQFEPDVRRKIGRLLVPYVKVAVKDRRMFLYKGHPARRLLNTVAEACEGNRGEGTQERELLDQVDGTIDRLVTEYNEDVAIFETLEQDLRAYMAQQRKRAELTERRAAEAQRGRERLDAARTEAVSDVAQRRGGRELPPAMDAFFNGYAIHHLCQVALRDGRGSPRYGAALRALMGLVAAFDHAELGASLDSLPKLDRATLLEMLASSGCAGDAAERAVDVLNDTIVQLAFGNDAAAAAARLPEQQTLTAPEPAPEPERPLFPVDATLDYDPEQVERIRAIEMGTWVQLTTESGRIEPAKASWVSPISGRLLFVNRRGIRVLVASPEELAAMCKAGRLRLRDNDGAFDEAMQQIMGRLKSSVAGESTSIH